MRHRGKGWGPAKWFQGHRVGISEKWEEKGRDKG